MSAWPEAVYIIKQISKLLNLDKRVLKLQNRLYVFAKQTTKEGKTVPDLEEEYEFSNDSIWFVQNENDSNEITAISVFSEQQGWSSFIYINTNAGRVSYSGPTGILSGVTNVRDALNTIATYLKNLDTTIPTASNSTKGIVQIGTNISVNNNGVISVPPASNSTAGVVRVGSNISIDNNGIISIPSASSSVRGVTKLYTDSNGSNTDGSMTQAAIKTYVSNAAIGAYQATANNIPSLINEVRNYGVRMGSFGLASDFTNSSIVLPAGRYNFEWISFNDANNGTLLLMPNGSNNDSIGLYSMRYTGGQVEKMYSFKHPTGNATTAQVLSGSTFSNATGTGLTGQMANNGALGTTLTPSTTQQSYTIPAGYTTGGTVTCSAVSAKKTLGSTNSDNVDMGGAYRYVDTRAVANATRVDGTLDNAANLLSGYTAYGKNGTKYTGSMTNVASGNKYTFTPSASAQSFTIPKGYHNGTDTTVKCNPVNNTGTVLVGNEAGSIWQYWTSDGTLVTQDLKQDLGATNLYRYADLTNAITSGFTTAINGLYKTGQFSMYAAANTHAKKTCTIKTTTNRVRIVVLGAIRAADNSHLLSYQLKEGGTARDTVNQTSSNIAGFASYSYSMEKNATSTVQLVETAGDLGEGPGYYRATWICVFAIPRFAYDVQNSQNIGVSVTWS